MKKGSILALVAVLILVAVIGIIYVNRHHAQTANAGVSQDQAGNSGNQGPGENQVDAHPDAVQNGDNASNGAAGGYSGHQTPGSQTAGNYETAKNGTVLASQAAAVAPDITDNGQYAIDSADKLIKVYPKTGTWDAPFVAIPLHEKNTVHPAFSADAAETQAFSPGEFLVGMESVFGIISRTSPASSTQPYYLHYEKLPSKLIFGNWRSPIYEVPLKK